MASTAETTAISTFSSILYTNIAHELDHCFSDGERCSQWDYENQITIENVKGLNISKGILYNVTYYSQLPYLY